MSALKFKALPGVDAYEVIRDGVSLGQVEHVNVQVTVLRAASARLSIVKKWRFQMFGAMPSRLMYGTRKACASALATRVDLLKVVSP